MLTRAHTLRYVLKNRETNKELFVVKIELLPSDEAKKEGVEAPEEKLEKAHGEAAKTGGDDDELD